jgi:hypothetical protein
MKDIEIEALNLAVEKGYASPGLFQRVLQIDYDKAHELVENLAVIRVIGPMDGAKPRIILADTDKSFDELIEESKIICMMTQKCSGDLLSKCLGIKPALADCLYGNLESMGFIKNDAKNL